MAKLFEFLVNHWMLSGAFVVVLVLFIANELRQRAGSATRLTPHQAVNLMNHDDAAMVDLRHTEAFREGHIVNSQNVPFADLKGKTASLKKLKKKPIILVCEQGGQSYKAVNTLKEEGFEQVYTLQGGILGWKAESLPLTKKD